MIISALWVSLNVVLSSLGAFFGAQCQQAARHSHHGRQASNAGFWWAEETWFALETEATQGAFYDTTMHSWRVYYLFLRRWPSRRCRWRSSSLMWLRAHGASYTIPGRRCLSARCSCSFHSVAFEAGRQRSLQCNRRRHLRQAGKSGLVAALAAPKGLQNVAFSSTG